MMLTSLSSKDGFGRAFGVERAGDNAGAIIGPLLASALVGIIGIGHAILLSFLPGILAAATAVAILLYTAHNGAATVMSLLGGQLADRIGPRAVFTAGAAVYIAAYVILAIGPTSWPILLLAFLLAGVGIGFAETAESTVVAQQLPDLLRANGFGVLGLTQSIGDLFATVVAGILWATVSPALAFFYAATWMLASVIASRLLSTRSPDGRHDAA